MDISNYQRKLFDVIDRNYLLNGQEGKPHDDGVIIQNYTNKIQANSYANYPHKSYSQLDGFTNLGTFGKANSQPSKLPKPTINCTPRKNDTSSRFNYAFDKQIDNRYIDVSGQYIPSNKLREIHNSGIQLCYQNRIIPDNSEFLQLSKRLANILGSDNTFKLSKSDLKYKIKNKKLTRKELTELVSKDAKVFQNNNGILGIPNISPQQIPNLPSITSTLRKPLNFNQTDGFNDPEFKPSKKLKNQIEPLFII